MAAPSYEELTGASSTPTNTEPTPAPQARVPTYEELISSPPAKTPSYEELTSTPKENFDRVSAKKGFDPIAHVAENPDDIDLATDWQYAESQKPMTMSGALDTAGDFASGAVEGIIQGVPQLVRGAAKTAANVAGIASAKLQGAGMEDDVYAQQKRELAAGARLGTVGTGKMIDSALNKAQQFGRFVTGRETTREDIKEHLKSQADYMRRMSSAERGELPTDQGGGNAFEKFVYGEQRMPEMDEKQTAQFRRNIGDIGEILEPSNFIPGGLALKPGKYLAKAAGTALKVGGKAVEKTGEFVAEGAERIARNKLARATTIPAVILTGGTAVGTAATGLATGAVTWAGAKFAQNAGKLAREAGEELTGGFAPVGQSALRKMTKSAIAGGTVGGVTSLPIMLGTESAYEAGAMVGPGTAIGAGATLLRPRLRGIESGALYGELVRDGQNIDYGSAAEAAKAVAAMQNLSPEDQNAIYATRGFYNGQTTKNGIPITVNALTAAEFGAKHGQISAGVFVESTGQLDINVETKRGIAYAMAHEGKHAMDSALLATNPKLHSDMFDGLKQQFTVNGDGVTATPEFAKWIDGQMQLHLKNLQANGATPAQINNAKANLGDMDYWLNEASADIGQGLITGRDLGEFMLPPSMGSKIRDTVLDIAASIGIRNDRGQLKLAGTGDVIKLIREQLYQQSAPVRERLDRQRVAANSATPGTPGTPGTPPVTPVTPPVTPVAPVTPVTPPVTPATPVTPVTPASASSASIPAFMTRQMEQQLSDLGYFRAERATMTPQQAMDIINAGVYNPGTPVTPVAPVVPVTPATPVTPVTPVAPVTSVTPASAPASAAADPAAAPTPAAIGDEVSFMGQPRIIASRMEHPQEPGKFLVSFADDPRTFVYESDLDAAEAPAVVATPPVDAPISVTRVTPVVPAAPGPIPGDITRDEIQAITNDAREAYLKGKEVAQKGPNKGQHTQKNQDAANKAAFQAVAEAHAARLPADYDGIKLTASPLGHPEVSGTIQPGRPFDDYLLELAGMPEGDPRRATIQSIQDKIGDTISITYAHAPGKVTDPNYAATRRASQRKNPAKWRISQGTAQNETKVFKPQKMKFSFGERSINTLGTNPEKLLGNFGWAEEAMGVAGEPMPYRNVSDPRFVADLKGLQANHDAGFTWEGKPIVGLETYPLATNKQSAERAPYQGFLDRNGVPDVQRFEFLNLLLGNEDSRYGKTQTPIQKAKLDLARENRGKASPPIREDGKGETNELRERLNTAMGPQALLDADGNPTGKTDRWSKTFLEDPLSEMLRIDNILAIAPAVERGVSPLHEHAYSGDLDRHLGSLKTVNTEQERIAAAGRYMLEEEATPQAKARARQRDRSYMAAVNSGDEDEQMRLVDEAAKASGYEVGIAEHRTPSENLEGNKFDLNRAGSIGGGRTNFRTPAVYFAVVSEQTREMLQMFEEKGYPPPYGGKVIRAYLKIKDGVDFDEIDSGGNRILGITDVSRIKSADPITRDDQGNVIPLSERFNPNTSDIRYMPEEEATPKAKARARQRDRDYMAAVAAGDREEQGRLRDEAANAAGYRQKRFHQTSEAAKQAIYREGFRLDKGRARLGDDQVPDAFFFKADPQDIKVGSADNPVQIPVFLKFKNPLAFETREQVDAWANRIPEYKAIVTKRRDFDAAQSSEFDRRWADYTKLDRTDPDRINYRQDQLEKFTAQWGKDSDEMAAEARSILTQALRADGYDAVMLENDKGSFNRTTKTTVVFDPSQIKSADLITRDNQGRVIPLSERFNPNTSDIRFMSEEEATTQAKVKLRQRDRSYMAAVAAGDRKKQQQLVDAAAKAAGYNVNRPVYHGTNREFNEFRLSNTGKYGERIYTTTSKEIAEDYAKSRADRSGGTPRVIKLYANRNVYTTGDIITATRSSDLKSADPITRDDQGNVIPLSERFNPNTSDIRYMPEEEAAPRAKAKLRQRDRKYMAAVEAGDIETARQIMIKAARELGYTIESFHGTNGEEFTTFDLEMGGDKTAAESAQKGIFSTDNRNVAQSYANNIGIGGALSLALGTDNPLAQARTKALETPEGKQVLAQFEAARKGINEASQQVIQRLRAEIEQQPGMAEGIEKLVSLGIDKETVLETLINRKFVDGNEANDAPELKAAYARETEAERALSEFLLPTIQDALPNRRVMNLRVKMKNPKIYDAQGKTPGEFALSERIQKAKDEGHDGVIFENIIDPDEPATHYVVFDPSQIKSADTITRDDQGNVIPLSERFNPATGDIRYMPEDDAGYRGIHTAPMRDSGSPLHNLKDTYPDDIYSSEGAQFYGHYGDERDIHSISVIKSIKGKPNANVRIFRAVPKDITVADKIAGISKQKAYIQKYGKVPPGVDTKLNRSDYYDKISEELEKLEALPPEEKRATLKINAGDWVTIDREYARDHGKATLNGQYRLISKVVKARDIFTNGDSIHEWGYDPQPALDAGKSFMPEDASTAGAEEKPSSIKRRAATLWKEKGTDSPFFRRFFGIGETESKVVDKITGQPLTVFHGTARPDRVADRFRKSRATSGPMAFFTDARDIAENYSKGKADTSLEYPSDYRDWFAIKTPGSKRETNLRDAWFNLTSEKRADVNKKLLEVGYENFDEGEGAIVSGSRSIMNPESIAYEIRQAKGNGLEAAKSIWLDSGSLFNDEVRFLEVLKALGIEGARLNDPNQKNPYVYEVYLNIKNPLRSSNVPASVVDALQQAAKRQRKRPEIYGADQWDKNTRDPVEWITAFAKDVETYNKNKDAAHFMSLTSIPDWVTKTLKSLGFDGIQDVGGKQGGKSHDVWIPFDENQVKSATDNSGTFDLEKKSINFMPEEESSEPFYSQLTRTIQGLPQDRMTVAQAISAIQKGSRKAERELSGIFTDPLSPLFGKQPGDKVTKEELAGYALERQATVQDVVLGRGKVKTFEKWVKDNGYGPDAIAEFGGTLRRSYEAFKQTESQKEGGTKFSQPDLQLPGADEGSYREMFVTWPAKRKILPAGEGQSLEEQILQSRDEAMLGVWRDGHSQYSDIVNPIVRIRRNIRTDANGKRTYFIEEMQGPLESQQENVPLELRKRIYEIGMKRALRDAVDEGADAIAWTTGKQQIDRYEEAIRQNIDRLEYEPFNDDSGNQLYEVAASKKGKEVFTEDDVTPERLAELVGKDIAAKIEAGHGQSLKEERPLRPGWMAIEGKDLSIGGHGLKAVYDQMLPAITNKLAEKFGAKAGMAKIEDVENLKRYVQNYTAWLEYVDPDGLTSRDEFYAMTEAEKIAAVPRDEFFTTSVHSLPIPEALKAQQRGGNALFMPEDERQTPQERAKARILGRYPNEDETNRMDGPVAQEGIKRFMAEDDFYKIRAPAGIRQESIRFEDEDTGKISYSALPTWTMRKLKTSLGKEITGKKHGGAAETFRRIDFALEKIRDDPSRIGSARGYAEFNRDAGVHGQILTPPTMAKLIIETPGKYIDFLTGGYHGKKTTPGTGDAAKSGLDWTVKMRSEIEANGGLVPKWNLVLHHFWGLLSRMATPVQQEGLWLRMLTHRPLLDAMQHSIDGNYNNWIEDQFNSNRTALEKKTLKMRTNKKGEVRPLDERDVWASIVMDSRAATADGSDQIGNQVTSNANAMHAMLMNWDGLWDDVQSIYTAPNSQQMGRRFWALNKGSVGIANKVQRFIGLTYGIPGLIMDRWKFVEMWLPTLMEAKGVKSPQDYWKYNNAGTPSDPFSLYGAYGGIENGAQVFSLAFYEGMEAALQGAIDNSPEIKSFLGDHANVGGLHWYGWNAIKNEAVGHSSLDLSYDLLRNNRGKEITAKDVENLVKNNTYYTETQLENGSTQRLTITNGKPSAKIIAPKLSDGLGGSGGSGRGGRTDVAGSKSETSAMGSESENPTKPSKVKKAGQASFMPEGEPQTPQERAKARQRARLTPYDPEEDARPEQIDIASLNRNAEAVRVMLQEESGGYDIAAQINGKFEPLARDVPHDRLADYIGERAKDVPIGTTTKLLTRESGKRFMPEEGKPKPDSTEQGKHIHDRFTEQETLDKLRGWLSGMEKTAPAQKAKLFAAAGMVMDIGKERLGKWPEVSTSGISDSIYISTPHRNWMHGSIGNKVRISDHRGPRNEGMILSPKDVQANLEWEAMQNPAPGENLRFMPESSPEAPRQRPDPREAAIKRQAEKAGFNTREMWRADDPDAIPNVLDKTASGAIYTATDSEPAYYFARQYGGDYDKGVRKFYLKHSNLASVADVIRVGKNPYRRSSVSNLSKEEVDALKAAGFDGVKGAIDNVNGTEIAVFDPRNIKLASPMTTDDAGREIPIESRFSESNDVRFMPEIPSADSVTSALSADKKPFVNAHTKLAKGTPVGVRIDIPAYERTGTYVQTVHEKAAGGRVGKRIGYGAIVHINKPKFFSNEAGAERIRDGSAKFPVATVEGEYDPSEDIPEDIATWTAVGYNPKRHSYFYTKSTGEPVDGGEAAISIGNTVFVKNPVMGDKANHRFMPENAATAPRNAPNAREAARRRMTARTQQERLERELAAAR